MKTYRVKSIFPTIQGEGQRAGTAAVFVRLVGCNLWSGHDKDRVDDVLRHSVACPAWCDTDFTKDGSQAMTALEIIAVAQRVSESAFYMVFTGGEPLLQMDVALVAEVQRAGFTVGIETNGTQSIASWIQASMGVVDEEGRPIGPQIDARRLWIVCSPKVPLPTVEVIDELKLVLPDYHPRSFAYLHEWLERVSQRGESDTRCLFVQPEDGPRQADAVAACVAWVHENPWWRVSIQTHKLLNVQ